MTLYGDPWLAGLFEGEGCLHYRKNVNSWELVIAMTDRDVIERVQQEARVGTVVRVDRGRIPNNQDQWRWRVGRREDVHDLVRRLLPYMGQRRAEQMRSFLVWYASGCPSQRTDADRALNAQRAREWRARHRSA